MTALKQRAVVRVSRRLGLGIAGSIVGLSTLLTFAYNPFQDPAATGPVPTRWPSSSITWQFNPTLGTNLDTTDPSQVATVLTNAFNAWSGTNAKLSPATTISLLTVMRGADNTTPDPAIDNMNIVSLVPSTNVKFPTGVIAFAQVASTAGTLIDADIVFNPVELFSVMTPPAGGRFDLQSVASHEFGHAIGLDHSGIAHTVMYPFGDTRASNQQRNLAVDDIVGVAFLYPAPPFCPSGTTTFNCSLGVIAGRITLNGAGIYASHVVAIDTSTGNAVVDSLTNPDGTYKLVGVPPGTYNVLALPLGPDANTGVYSLDNFSGWTCGFVPNAPPCCDPAREPATCTGQRLPNPTNYTGKFF